MQVHDKTTATFDALENSWLFGDDQLEAVEEHILRTYDPPLRAQSSKASTTLAPRFRRKLRSCTAYRMEAKCQAIRPG